DVADGLVAVGGNGADLRDHLARHRLRQLLHFLDGHFYGLLDAALDGHRVRAGGHALHAFAENRLRQDGGGGRAVPSYVGGLRSHLAHHLRAHVLERILQLDLFGYRHTVLRDVAAGILSEKDAISNLDIQGKQLAVLQTLAISHGDYFAFLGLLFGGVGDDDTTPNRFLLLDAFHHNSIVQWSNFHELTAPL